MKGKIWITLVLLVIVSFTSAGKINSQWEIFFWSKIGHFFSLINEK